MNDYVTKKGVTSSKYSSYIFAFFLTIAADYIEYNKLISSILFFSVIILDYFLTHFSFKNKYSYYLSNTSNTDTRYFVLFAIVFLYYSSSLLNTNYDNSTKDSSTRISLFREKPQSIVESDYVKFLSQYRIYDRYHNQQGKLGGKFSLVSDRIVIEKYSGLMWERGGSSVGTTWNHIADHINLLNSSRFGGYDDWRVPTLEELSSLFKNNNSNIYFHDLFQSDIKLIWSTDSVLSDSSSAWYANFNLGRALTAPINTKYYVKGVRRCTEIAVCQ